MNKDSNWLDVYSVDILANSREIAKTIYPYNNSSKKSYNCELEFVQQLLLNFENYENIVVPLSERWYSKNQRLRKLFFSYKIVIRMIDFLEKDDWISVKKGWIDKRFNYSRLTTVEKTDKLKLLLEQFRNNNYENYFPWDEILIKNGEDEFIDYKDTNFTKEKRKFIKAYNAFLLDSNIDLPKNVNINNSIKNVATPFLYRVFHKHGKELFCGRFYSFGTKKASYLSIKKEDRARIKIEDEETIELDFSCLHINLAYLLLGTQAPQTDIYDLIDFNIDRNLKKKMLLIMINAKDEKSADRAFFDRGKNGISFEIVRALRIKIQETFKDKQSIFCSGIGIKLQYHDSEIMEMILKECFKQNIVALPIHDAIMIKASEKGMGTEIMRKCYQEYCVREFNLDFTPDIEIK